VGREPAERLLVALDEPALDRAVALLDRLRGVIRGVKIGSVLFTAAGPAAVAAARERGFTVFLDLKFHDIPTAVAGAVRAAVRLGANMLSVHAAGGLAMLRAAAQAAADEAGGAGRPRILGVTVLTSLDRRALDVELGVPTSLEAHVLHLARLCREAGLDGCVASPRETALLRTHLGRSWLIVTPGVRPAASADDQVRTATPAAALRAGADYLVVGRPVTGAPDPVAAVRALLAEWPPA
jgi:orotidine-5'-phosphate decarboxylase